MRKSITKLLTRFIKPILCCALVFLAVQSSLAKDGKEEKIRLSNTGQEEQFNSSDSKKLLLPNDLNFQQGDDLVTDMISHGMRKIIDDNFFVQYGRIVSAMNSDDFDLNATAMVKNVIWLNDLPFSELFEGFSESILLQANELWELNGKRVGDSSSKIPSSEFDQLKDKLEENAINEAVVFINEYMSDAELESLTGKYLTVEDYMLDGNSNMDDQLGDLSLDPDLFDSGSDPKRGKGGKEDFSERVVELLEENNRILSSYSGMFENLQRQIDEINARDYDDVRQEIAELRKIVKELESNPSSSSNPEEYIIYPKNKFDLNLLQKTKLNRFVVLMAKNPEKRLLIVGFADKTGNVEYNAWISQQRALSVKNYLLSMGVDADRIVLSYFGDTESTSSSPADRRVELSLIN